MASITYLQGDATYPVGSGMKTIVHIVNDTGLWGAGFVLALARRWPQTRRAYLAHRHYTLGDVQYVPVTDDIDVVNLVGQHGLRSPTNPHPVRYEAVAAGLQKIAGYADIDRTTVHMPRIGCGLGGGDWATMEPLIVHELCARGVSVIVYDLPDPTHKTLVRAIKLP